MFASEWIWQDGFWPNWVWDLLANLAVFGAIVAFLSAIAWLWSRGPALLIKHGGDRMTNVGEKWDERRDK